ncbi:PBP1A family penicillin-binding protein [Cytobacillus gottheilii]|uniref:PBP1A family penicillin-binding protein n=1 Tax=Cytobacillus gottheilii TaxID=859144 RepID=UPI002495428C|nr:PBP1A family penicillin-binding protein [Cytobacillus gottheilii]
MAEKFQSREERRKELASKPKNKGKKKSKNIFKRIFLTLIVLGIVGMIAGAATFAFMVKDTPPLDESALKDPIPSEIFDSEGNTIAKVGSGKLDYVNYEDIPDLVENAFLATEDVRFYKHNGMDLIRLGGAVIANVTDGFGSEGASTITQQVVKNSFLNNEKTISRKAQEAWLAFQLERKYTKQEIFEMYVNKIWMSQGSHGVLTASKIYFGKELNELELHEAAMLAGMPQSPENYNPFKHPDRAEQRRNIVLSLMNQHGFITEEEMKAAQEIPVESSLVPEDQRETDDMPYDSFVDVVIDEVEDKYPDLDIFSDGLKIYTTLDVNAQKHVEGLLNGNDVIQYPDDEFQAGITLLDTKTGQIKAIGGGRNLEVKRGFNYAVDLRRHAGSTFKPIVDYGPVIENEQWGTYQTIVDEPYTYSGGTAINNWDNRHMGPMSMREALARSRNIPALKALQEVGLDQSKEFANKLGIPIETMLESYSIGAFEVSPLQMAGAYSAFGNNGFYTEPYSVKEIEMRDGTKIDAKPEAEVVMKDYTAFMISDMLKSVVNSSYGTGREANVPGLPVAGKTGTTNYTAEEIREYGVTNGGVPDAWFAGYTTNYTAAIWTGYTERKNFIKAGNDQRIAQQLFRNVMSYVSEGIETPDFEQPSSVEQVQIEKGSNPAKLASDYTPESQIINEYAVKGFAPDAVSDRFEKLNAPSELQAQYDPETNQVNVAWSYPDDLDGVQFDISVSLNEGAEQQLGTMSDTSLTLQDIEPGSIYRFTVRAIRGSLQSDPATASVEIPQADDNEEDQGSENDGENPGNGNGNGNGNNNGNGNGNGNSNGNGNGNDSGNEDGSDEGSGNGEDEDQNGSDNEDEDGENSGDSDGGGDEGSNNQQGSNSGGGQ